MTTRFDRIAAAYTDALAGRDPASVDVLDLLPAIFDAVPDTTPEEIAGVLRELSDRCMREAESLQRYHNAKFGNMPAA
jgi:hypothetical protein